MKVLATLVNCSVCGKKLRGHETLGGGFQVSHHKIGKTSTPCPGHLWSNHRPSLGRGGEHD